MKTIQITLDEDLLSRIDKAIQELNTTRSTLIQASFQYYLERLRIKKLEKKHRDGHLKQSVAKGKFDVWEGEQAWGI